MAAQLPPLQILLLSCYESFPWTATPPDCDFFFFELRKNKKNPKIALHIAYALQKFWHGVDGHLFQAWPISKHLNIKISLQIFPVEYFFFSY